MPRALLLLIAVLLGALGCAAGEDELLLFSFFRNNGEDGLYLAASDDGLAWKVLNGNRPLLKPEVGESKLMRDPSIARGPDGTFHMVWTTSWQGRTIGYASSKDLIHWSEQRAISVMPDEANLQNCWAPEVFYDQAHGEFVVIWASTIRGRFPETQGTGSAENNHRIYAFRTRDFRTIGPVRLFYDPGFMVIDAAIFRADNRYAMVVKNETLKPPAKYVFLTFSDSLDGPWTKPSAPISGDEWAEGPSPVKMGDWWYVYFDKYRKKQYGGARSKDLVHWEDLSGQLVFPEGARHGTAFRAPGRLVEPLRAPARLAEIAGKWTGAGVMFLATGESRETAIYVELRQSGDEIAGAAGPSPERALPISKAKVEGQKLIFEVVAPVELTGDGVVTFEATISGDKMEVAGKCQRFTSKASLSRLAE